jgi:hypothetical protein
MARLIIDFFPPILSEYTGSSMLLDLHIEGSAPVTLLVRDESRSTRSTSGYMEDDKSVQGHSEENLARLEAKNQRKFHNVSQRLHTSIGDDSFDTFSNNQEKKRRAKKHNDAKKHAKKKFQGGAEIKGDLETSMSVSSSKSSLFLDSFHSESEKGGSKSKEGLVSKHESKSCCSSDESRNDSEDGKSSNSSNKRQSKGIWT